MADNEILTNLEPDEEYSPIDVKDLDKERVKLGRQGENQTQTVQINCNDWLVELQGCTFMVVAMRPGERELYVPDVQVNLGMITWPITAQDTACAGAGRAEVRAIKGDQVKKSKLFRTWIEPALDGNINGTPTTPPNWVKETKDALEQANALMADALAAANSANTAAENLGGEVEAAKTDALDAIAAAKDDAAGAAEESIADIENARDAATEAVQAAREAAVADAAEAMDDIKTEVVASGVAALENAKDAKVEEINAVKTNAEALAAAAVEMAENAQVNATEALTKATNAENDAAAISTDVDELKTNIQRLDVQGESLFGGVLHDTENNILYFLNKNGQVIAEVDDIGRGGGGGGGGGSDSGSVLKMENISGWNTVILPVDDDDTIPSCVVTLRWSSIKDELPTGSGTLKITVGSRDVAAITVAQGDVAIDMAQYNDYISNGISTVTFLITDVYGKTGRSIITLDVRKEYITTTFDDTQAYKGAIPYSYTPNGAGHKTVYYEMDGEVIATAQTSVNGHQQSYTIPKQTNGSHVFRVWFETEINGTTVKSNVLYHELICIDPMATERIITSPFNRTEVMQFETLRMPWNVYDPLSLEAEVTITVNDVVVSTVVASRETQYFEYRVRNIGALKIEIISGTTVKTFNLTATDAGVHPEVITDQLNLMLSAAGRSNSEADPAVWEYQNGSETVKAVFSGYNWTRDGWITEDGITGLRCMGGSGATIQTKPYEQDFRSTGKTIEIEFKAHNVMTYDAPIISCMNGGRGFEIYANRAVYKSARAEVVARFIPNRRIRLTLAVQPQSADRLVYLYIDGEYQGISQYSATDSFQQLIPENITVGMNELCGVDLYNVYVYDRYLTMREVLDNFIASRQDVFEMLSLYSENSVYDDNGAVKPELLPHTLPWFRMTAAELPQYKGDKKHIVFDYVEPANEARRLHAEGVLADVQGTSSQYYAVKNIKITFENGATMGGRLVIGFTIRDGSIMVETFTIKADVASSEGANNIVGAKLYDALARKLNIITPAQQANSAVRQGMDGFALVGFADFGDGDVFLGKYNFNNDKGTFEIFGYEEGDEVWDVRDNTSLLTMFHTNVFGENWYKEDYEAIYPKGSSSTEHLKPMTDFLYSTWMDGATDEALAAPVTYDGTTYTNDTREYRLAKYLAEFENWFHLRNHLFYFCFTFGLLMVDSLQKNMHPFYIAKLKKWWQQIYDADTLGGTDNRGGLSFQAWMEYLDKFDGQYVFNGAENVLWVNMWHGMKAKLADMWAEMRASGMWSADYVVKLWKEHQSAWPKAIRNEDGEIKYVDPLRKTGTTQYLPMGQGSKEWQFQDFIYDRFPYVDGFFDVADALKSIMWRPYFEITEAERQAGKVDLKVQLYKPGYATVMFNDIKVSKRVLEADYPDLTVDIKNPLIFANDAVCAFHNGANIRDIWGLENCFVGYWDSDYGENLQALRLGSQEPGYQNPVTESVSVGANEKLLYVEMTNCINFGNKTQKTLGLSQCPNIKIIHLGGTAAQGVDVPNGGILEELVMPATTSSLVLRNHPRLTDDKLTVEGWANIDQLWLENMSGLDELAILKKVPANTAVRLVGFDWTMPWEEGDTTGYPEIKAIYDLLDTMRGIEINGQGQGYEVDDAQVSGTIHVAFLKGSEYAELQARYPSITIDAEHITSYETFMLWDGSETVKVIRATDGVLDEAAPSVPARASTAQYDYTAVGWSREKDASTAQADATTNVIADRIVYAAYSRKVRSHNITWNPNNGGSNTVESYKYGDTPVPPISPTKDGQAATGWTPDIVPVTGPATYTATYINYYTATFVRAAEDGGGTLKEKKFAQDTQVTYDGETPTSTREGYKFKGWSPALGKITANTTYTAVFEANGTVWTDPSFDVADTYAAQWDYSQNKTGLARGGLAASFADPVPATDLTGSGSSPFDTVAPWKDMKRYNVVNGALVPDTDASFDETNNDTVVYIPEFYYKAEKDTDKTRWTWAISPTAKTGYEKHPGSGVYVGRFHTSGDSSAVFTKAGASPLVNTTRASFRTYSTAKGTGWRQMDLKVWSAIQMLYLVEFANWYSQDVLGTGQDSGSIQNTGATVGAAYHTIKRSKASNAYRWIENPFSNVYTFVDGYVASSRASYIGTDPASYGDTTTGLEAAGITLPSSGYISGLGYSDKCPWAFIPDTASGSETTYVTDRVFSSTGAYVLFVGGGYSASASYGMFCFGASGAASYTNGYLGSRLLYQP